jgi:hypothetical protein
LKGLLDDDVSSNILFLIDDFVPPETLKVRSLKLLKFPKLPSLNYNIFIFQLQCLF